METRNIIRVESETGNVDFLAAVAVKWCFKASVKRNRVLHNGNTSHFSPSLVTNTASWNDSLTTVSIWPWNCLLRALKYKGPSPSSESDHLRSKIMIISPHFGLLVATVLLLFAGVNGKACKSPFAEHSCEAADDCSDRGGAPRKDSSCADDGRNSSSHKR